MLRLSQWLSLITWLSFLSSAVTAQTIELRARPETALELGGHLLLLEDKEGSLSFDEVRQLPDDAFLQPLGKVPSFGFTRSTYWGRLRINHTGSEALPLVLEYSYPMADYVDIYILDSKGQVSTLHSGDKVSSAHRPYRYRLPAFGWTATPGVYELHIRVRTEGVIQLPLSLQSQESFDDKRVVETAIWGIIFGGIAAIFLYNLSLFVTTRNPLILIYSVWIGVGSFSYGAQQGLMNIIFRYEDNSWINNEGAILFGGLSTAFGMLFGLRFFQVNARDGILRWIYWAFFFTAAVQVVASFFTYNLPAKLGVINLAGGVLTVFYTALKRLFEKDQSALYFVIAWSLFISGGVVFALTTAAILPVTILSQFSVSVGQLFENIFLSLALGYKLRRELADALQENQRINTELMDKEKARTLFFHNTSHELRTPLNGIIGFLDLIIQHRYGAIPDAVQKQLSKSLRLAESLKNQVNTILDLARSKRGELTLKRQLISLPELLNDANHLAEGLCLKSGNLRFSSEWINESQNKPTINDTDKVATIIRNLLGNAFKFTDPFRENHVRLTLKTTGEGLQIIVQDQGIGIPQDAKDKIFEEFAQVRGDARRSYEGTGLGLSLVRDLVRLMEGKIQLESQEGQGSCFTVMLPNQPELDLEAPQDQAAPILARPLESGVPGPEKPRAVLIPADGTQNGKVLVVDDNETNCEVISEILRAESYEVQFVTNGRMGLLAMAKARPDVVLLDMMMPEMSGADVIEFMRQDPELREIPVILVTARASEEDRMSGLGLGADDYLAKPIVAREMLLRVGNMIERHRLVRLVERMESHDKLIQLGELFSDLSHELKNILHGGSVADLTSEDATQALAAISFSDSDRSRLAEGLSSRTEHPEALKRVELLTIAQEAELPRIRRSLRIYLASLDLPTATLQELWQHVNGLNLDELVHLESQVRVLSRYQTLHATVYRTRELSASVLSYLRSGSEQTECELNSVWQEVLHLVKGRVKRHKVQVNPQVKNLSLSMGSAKLIQIFLNLVMNALDALEGITQEDRWIRVEWEEDGDSLRILVKNGGPQIAAEAQERLFQRGFTTKGDSGTGLGLSVSRRLARMLGGELEFDASGSSPCFVLKLPYSSERKSGLVA
jgi:signal transduction histidine kinase